MTARKTALKNAIKSKKKPKRDFVGDIMAYEGGEMSEEDAIKMFQKLVDSGDVWRLQGSYGRTAMAMLEAGVIKKPKKVGGKTKYGYYGEEINYQLL